MKILFMVVVGAVIGASQFISYQKTNLFFRESTAVDTRVDSEAAG
ncbi:hypothetical protein ACFX4I_21085 [Peribacillus sp. YIM B13472]